MRNLSTEVLINSITCISGYFQALTEIIFETFLQTLDHDNLSSTNTPRNLVTEFTELTIILIRLVMETHVISFIDIQR